MMRTLFKNRLAVILIVLIVFTVGFIFSRSAVPKEESKKESDTAAGVVEVVIPERPPIEVFIVKNIRKIAHFIEFGVLGAQVCALSMLLFKKKSFENNEGKKSVFIKYLINVIAFGILIAFCDETIQIFSKRGPLISDVWIDFLGYFSFSALFFLISLLIMLILSKRKNT